MAKTISQLPDATSVADSDELIVQQSGITKRASKLEVLAGIKNASIASDAAIAFSKLAALDSANILVGNGSNVATKVAVTGDVTISNAGVTAIGSAKVTPTMLTQPLTLATAQNTTSGTSIDFTAIPSWVRRITVLLSGVSLSGSSNLLIQLGDSGGIETTGYAGSSVVAGNAVASAGALFTTGIGVMGNFASNIIHGVVVIHLAGSNLWVAGGSYGYENAAFSGSTGGSKTLSGTLDRVRLTTVNGTDTFDAGSVNIMYEG
jgi:hypothetical protein